MRIFVTYEVDATELWSSVMGSAWETFPWWSKVYYLGEADWDKPGAVRVAWDCEGIRGSAIITVQSLAQAYGQLGYGKHEVKDIDALVGDTIIQQATIGKVVFG